MASMTAGSSSRSCSQMLPLATQATKIETEDETTVKGGQNLKGCLLEKIYFLFSLLIFTLRQKGYTESVKHIK